MNPCISVIIPVFNDAQYIREAVESVLNQTFDDFEIIVVDDGSTDGTRAVLEPWIKDDTIRYVYQNNRGGCAARNVGISLAQGKYLKFLDADDFLYPQQFERQVKHLENKPDFVFSMTNYEIEFLNKNKKSINVQMCGRSQLAKFIENNLGPPIAYLIHRNLVERAGCFDEGLTSYQDLDLWFRVLLQGGVCELLDYTSCCYRLLENTVSTDPSKQFEPRCKTFEKLNTSLLPQLEQLPEDVIDQLFKKNINLVHECFFRRVDPLLCVPAGMKIVSAIYDKRLKGFKKYVFKFCGVKRIMLAKYFKECHLNKQYTDQFMNIAWRDERNYK